MGKAGSRTVLVVYRTLGSYVGFGVHQIEFATTHSFTHSLAHTLFLALLPSSHHHRFFGSLCQACLASRSLLLIFSVPVVLQNFCLLPSSALHVTVAPT